MSQTAYAETMAANFEGMLADVSMKVVDSFTQGEASAEMPFGIMLAKGTGDREAILPAASNAKLIGILMHSHHYAKGDGGELGTTGVKPKATLNILRKGRLVVKVETTVAKYDRAFVRYATGAGGTQLGAWRNAAVTNETIDLGTKAQFMSAASAGGLAVVEVDMLN